MALFNVLWVGVGGFVGSVSRYLVSGWVHRIVPAATFPLGTLVVNAAGCFFIGLLAGWGDSRQIFTPTMRLFLFIGVLGGFTTFSSFAYETMAIAQEGALQRGLLNIFLQLVLGLSAVWIGYVVARAA